MGARCRGTHQDGPCGTSVDRQARIRGPRDASLTQWRRLRAQVRPPVPGRCPRRPTAVHARIPKPPRVCGTAAETRHGLRPRMRDPPMPGTASGMSGTFSPSGDPLCRHGTSRRGCRRAQSGQGPSPLLAYNPRVYFSWRMVGGSRGIRTPDSRIKSPVLYLAEP